MIIASRDMSKIITDNFDHCYLYTKHASIWI